MPEPIKLFPNVEILPNGTMQQTKKYLDRHCTYDTLGDTIYVKKLGNDGTTYAIQFECDEISHVKKIKDTHGDNTDEMIFQRDSDYDAMYDDENYNQNDSENDSDIKDHTCNDHYLQ